MFCLRVVYTINPSKITTTKLMYRQTLHFGYISKSDGNRTCYASTITRFKEILYKNNTFDFDLFLDSKVSCFRVAQALPDIQYKLKHSLNIKTNSESFFFPFQQLTSSNFVISLRNKRHINAFKL